MSDQKTVPTGKGVEEFLHSVENETRRKDGLALVELMSEVTGEAPKMWGPSIVGFGAYHYKYASGREGDSPLTGFSPRKQSLTLYIMSGFDEYDELLGRLGKHKTGKACLYVNKLADVDQEVLKELVRKSFEHMKATNEVVE